MQHLGLKEVVHCQGPAWGPPVWGWACLWNPDVRKLSAMIIEAMPKTAEAQPEGPQGDAIPEKLSSFQGGGSRFRQCRRLGLLGSCLPWAWLRAQTCLSVPGLSP